MSRIGRQPVPIPQGVDVQVDAQKVFVKGPLGALTRPIPPDITVAVADGKAVVQRTAEAWKTSRPVPPYPRSTANGSPAAPAT